MLRAQSGQYYASRDLLAWQQAYRRVGFHVVNVERGHSADWSVLLCLGLRRQTEKCISPLRILSLRRSARVNQFGGMRSVLWRKDAFCSTMTVSLGS